MPKLKSSLISMLSKKSKETKKPYEKTPVKNSQITHTPSTQSCLHQLIPDKYNPPTILFVGEGNFSFTLSIARILQRGDTLLATCLDSEEIVKEKYPDAEEIIQEIKEWGGAVAYEVDGCSLRNHKAITKHKFESVPHQERTKKTYFDTIAFMFPHIGLGIKDRDRNVRENQKLLKRFLVSAKEFLKPQGRVVITIKEGLPYDLWELKALAKAEGFRCALSLKFKPEEFPDYFHRRTIGFKDGVSENTNQEIQKSRMYFFQQ
jgi:25S rRNA (uracil2634-N3)-methyltransferase